MAKRFTATQGLWPALAVCCVSALLPSVAHAEASAAQKAAAESLFDDGVKAMKAGRFAEACPKLEESERIDPGIGTLLYLGECYEKTGRTASAWATFREAASAAQAQGETERTRVASTRADRLQPALSKLTVRVAPETAQLASLRITRDNAVLVSALFGVAIPVDPGKYRIVASAEGFQNFEGEIEIGPNGDSKALEIPALKPGQSAPVVAPVDSTPAVTSAAAPPPPTEPGAPKSSSNGLRTASYITGAVGIVGIGVGSYFGIRAISKNSDAETHCPSGNTCTDQAGVDLTEQAKDAAVVSNIAFGVGAAFAVAGVVLYLSSDSAEKPAAARLRLSPMVSHNLAGLGLGGSFQ